MILDSAGSYLSEKEDLINNTRFAKEVIVNRNLRESFPNLTSDKMNINQNERIARLQKIGIPLIEPNLRKLVNWVDELKLRDRIQHYPCQFRYGIYTIEAHSPEEFFFILEVEDAEKYHTNEPYKIITYAWLLTLYPKRFIYMVSNMTNLEQVKAANREKILFQTFSKYSQSAHIHKLFCFPNQQVAILKDYPSGDFLHTLNKLKKRTTLISDHDKLQFAQDILTILSILHKNNIAHRDLRPENFFQKKKRLSLADYRFAYPIDSKKMKQPRGTFPYAAVELLTGQYQGNGIALDIWSVACILYLLFAEKHYPWFDFLTPRSGIVTRRRLTLARKAIEKFSEEKVSSSEQPLLDLLKKMFDLRPEKRLSADGALAIIKEYKARIGPNTYGKIFRQFQERIDEKESQYESLISTDRKFQTLSKWERAFKRPITNRDAINPLFTSGFIGCKKFLE